MIVLTDTEKEKIEKAMRAYKREELSKSATLEKITVMARKCIKYNYSLVKGYDTNILTKIAIEALKDAMDYYNRDLEPFISLVEYFITQKLDFHIKRFPSQLIPKYSTVMTNILRKYPELPSEKISDAREVISIIGESYLNEKTRSVVIQLM